jgi:hypothetical protein
MKKFGTPIGAGPGRAKEKVGLAGVGTPPLPVAFGLAGPFFLGALGPEFPLVPFEPGEDL